MCYANQKVAEAYSRSENLGILLKYFNQVIINTIQGEVIDVILPFEEQNFCLKDINAIRDLFSKSGALAYAEQEMNRYFELAIKSLKSMKFIPEEKETILFGLIWYLKLRKF